MSEEKYSIPSKAELERRRIQEQQQREKERLKREAELRRREAERLKREEKRRLEREAELRRREKEGLEREEKLRLEREEKLRLVREAEKIRKIKEEIQCQYEVERLKSSKIANNAKEEMDAQQKAALESFIESQAKHPVPSGVTPAQSLPLDTSSSSQDTETECTTLVISCQVLYEDLQALNAEAAAVHSHIMDEVNNKPSQERLPMILDALKLSYGREWEKVNRTQYYRELLTDLLVVDGNQDYPAELREKINKTLKASFISEKDLSDLEQECQEKAEKARRARHDQKARQEMDKIIRESLVEMAYEIIDEEGETFQVDKPYYFSTPNPDYRIQFTHTNEDGLSFKLLRVLDSEDDAEAASSDPQRLKDQEYGQIWCHDYDKILDILQKNGHPQDVLYRSESGNKPLGRVVKKRKKVQAKSALNEMKREKKS